MKMSIQLYSLRDLVGSPKDMYSLFPRLKALGFEGVELAGIPQDPAMFRNMLDEAGLVATGAHFGMDDLEEKNLQQTLAVCKTIGITMLGVGGAAHNNQKKLAKSCEVLKAAAEAAAPHGITVFYHNHESEFEPYKDGTFAIDSFLEACPLELDTHWSFCAGVDNYAYMIEHKDRICLIHIKDGVGKDTRALGEGETDLDAVVRAAKELGMEWLVLENDNPSPNGLSDAARSMVWLKENNVL